MKEEGIAKSDGNLSVAELKKELAACKSELAKVTSEKSQELNFLLQNTEESFVAINREFNIISYNNKFVASCKLYFEKEVEKGDSFLNYVLENKEEESRNILKKVFQGERLEIESAVDLGMHKKYIINIFKPAYNENKEIVAATISIIDITERREVENKLQISERRFKGLVEKSLDAVVVLSPEGMPIYASPSIFRVLGFTVEETLELDLFSFIHPDDIPVVGAEFEKAMSQPGISFNGSVTRIRHKDGSWRWCESSITNLVDDPAVGGIVDHFRDITERIEAENELLERQAQIDAYNERINNVINSISEPFFAINNNAEFIYMNKAAENITNRCEEELIGKNVFEIYPHIADLDIGKRVRKALVDKKSKTYEYFYQPHNLWYEQSIYPTSEGISIFFKSIVERKKTEQELRNALDERNEILERIKDGFYALDNDWSVTYWNNMAEEMLHVKKEDIIGKNLWEIFESAKSLKFYTEYQRSITEQKPLRFEEYYPATNLWVEVNTYPSETGLSVYFKDISESKAALEKIRSSEEQRSLIMKASLDAIISMDSEGLITFWNPQAEKIFGWKEEDVLGKGLSDIIIPPKYKERHDKGIKNYLSTGKGNIINKIIELSAVRKGNIEFPIELTVLPIKQDKETFFCAFIRDISERKEAENLLNKYTSQLESAQEIANLGYWELGLDGRTKYWSREMYKICGIEKQTGKVVRSHVFMNKIHPEDKQHFIDKFNESARDKKLLDVEFRFVLEDGTIKYLAGKGSPVYDEAGNALYMEGTMQDITYLKENEKQLRELNRLLEKRAHELAVSNTELEQFAYVASHDLQEPLRMVTSFLSQLDKKYKDQLDDKAHQYIDFAVDGATRMRKIILDLLEFSRVGRMDYKFEEIDMNQLIKDIVQLNSQIIEKKNAIVNFKDLPVVIAAKTPLQQVIQNLLGNSLKYQNPDVQPKIDIEVQEKKMHWHFIIRDNGIGIEPQFFEKIFIIFQRLHNRNDYSGTGIGLAICKKIVELHQGEIWLESESGKGSTFHFTISKLNKSKR